MPEIINDRLHTPRTIAPSLGVTQRRVQEICSHLFGEQRAYRLTDEQRQRVINHYLAFKRNRPKHDAFKN